MMNKEKITTITLILVLTILISPLLIFFGKAWKTMLDEAIEWNGRPSWEITTNPDIEKDN